MQVLSPAQLIYLGPNSFLPDFLQKIEGGCWILPQSLEEVKELLSQRQERTFVVIHRQELNLRAVQAFLSWTQFQPQLQFIFIGQTIERGTHQAALSEPRMLLVFESEGARIQTIVTRRVNGLEVKSRKRERRVLKSQVLIQGSSFEDPRSVKTPPGVIEGTITDFSRGGAQILVKEGQVKIKEFIRVLYREASGKWVSVESQVRWVSTGKVGIQTVGVQFLAVSA